MMKTRTRQIGRWGTGARAVVGAAFIAGAVALGVDLNEALLALVVLPAVVVVLLALRGRDAPPLRLHGSVGHMVNILGFFAVFSWQSQVALLFYGASMLVAAWRGIGACEMFAISNLLRRRDDQLGCPLFLPVDAAEARFTDRTLYCSPRADEAGPSPGP